MKKILFQITRLTLHTRNYRPTKNIFKSLKKYVFHSSIDSTRLENNNFEFEINLPEDLIEKLKTGEIQLDIPNERLSIYPGQDMVEKAKKIKNKERRELIHRNRNNTWRADNKDVK